jgi:hypothetical protein
MKKIAITGGIGSGKSFNNMKKIQEYIFPIIGICELIIGNIICYNIIGRLLMITTNFSVCVLIFFLFINVKKK